MKNNDQPKIVDINGWPFRVRQPANPTEQTQVMLLLHGHMGNENAMWILTNPLPNTYHLLAPRAPVQTGPDQYSWHEIGQDWPDITKYEHLTNELITRVDRWAIDNQINVKKYDVMGFSQGAAMAYALSILYPEKTGRVAALASFLPESWKDHLKHKDLEGKAFFIAHGTEDDIIPIDMARMAAEWLEEKGAHVTFCEADTGHKLSANCFNGLGDFFR